MVSHHAHYIVITLLDVIGRIFKLNVTNTGEEPLIFDTADLSIVDSASRAVLWADVRFIHENRVVEVGSADPILFTLLTGQSELAMVQFQGPATPGPGTYTATLLIPSNDPTTRVTEIPLRFHVNDFALVIVGLPKTLDVTMTPSSVVNRSIAIYNVYTEELHFEHQGCSCSAPLDQAALPCRIGSFLAVAQCSHDLELGGTIHVAVQLKASQTVGLY
jgi:hypothetical protein